MLPKKVHGLKAFVAKVGVLFRAATDHARQYPGLPSVGKL